MTATTTTGQARMQGLDGPATYAGRKVPGCLCDGLAGHGPMCLHGLMHRLCCGAAECGGPGYPLPVSAQLEQREGLICEECEHGRCAQVRVACRRADRVTAAEGRGDSASVPAEYRWHRRGSVHWSPPVMNPTYTVQRVADGWMVKRNAHVVTVADTLKGGKAAAFADSQAVKVAWAAERAS